MALKGHEAYLMTMGVSKEWRGKGFGRILLSQTIERMRQEEKIAKLRLHVLADNQVAIRLYQEAGFVCKSVDSQYYSIGGRLHTAWAMEMRLRADSPQCTLQSPSLFDRFRSLVMAR